jgi:WD40 repeat protein
LWDVATGQQQRTLQGDADYVDSVAFSPDGLYLASGGKDDTVRLWEIATGQILWSHQGPPFERPYFGGVISVAFSPDGRTVASSWIYRNNSMEGMVRLLDAASGKLLWSKSGGRLIDFSVTFSPDGRVLASAGASHAIKLWDPATGKLLSLLKCGSTPFSLAYTPDGCTLASGQTNKGVRTVELWDPAKEKLLRTIEGAGSDHEISFSRDGRYLASEGDNGTIQIWDAANGLLVHSLQCPSNSVSGAIFSPVSHTVTSGGKDMLIKLWDATGA